MPISVIPICAVESSLPGSAARSIAVRAPLRPPRAIASSRGLRDETIDSSLIANTPFSAMSATMMTQSIQGKGEAAWSTWPGLLAAKRAGGQPRDRAAFAQP